MDREQMTRVIKKDVALGAILFLQTLSNLSFLADTAPAGVQEEKGSGLESPPEWQVRLRKEFGTSLKISRQTLCKTSILARHYLSTRLSGAQLPLASSSEKLPSVSLNFSSWISLPNAERLSHMAKMLSYYRGLIQQLREYETTKEDSQFTAQFETLGLYLRDLNHHVNYQMSLWGLHQKDSLGPALEPPQILRHQSQWRNRLEVNYVLNNLKNLLCRVVRDFMLLRRRIA
uniref:Uncharacterized protein n=1 Tax=Sphaerodactylus townsendi TaxID=933632 RepID=A0ACB8EUZ5_9SAUR